jgi:hypothetical protein
MHRTACAETERKVTFLLSFVEQEIFFYVCHTLLLETIINAGFKNDSFV